VADAAGNGGRNGAFVLSRSAANMLRVRDNGWPFVRLVVGWGAVVEIGPVPISSRGYPVARAGRRVVVCKLGNGGIVRLEFAVPANGGGPYADGVAQGLDEGGAAN